MCTRLCYTARMFSTPSFENKLCPPQQLPARIGALQRPLVFTNGVFDILHRGHASYLAQARALGASLIVAVNSDASVRRLGVPARGSARRASCALVPAVPSAATHSSRKESPWRASMSSVGLSSVRAASASSVGCARRA